MLIEVIKDPEPSELARHGLPQDRSASKPGQHGVHPADS